VSLLQLRLKIFTKYKLLIYCLFVSESDYYCYDQNVMCMRSGLVIKTNPTVRTTSSRYQAESSQRCQWMSGSAGQSAGQQQQLSYSEGCNGDASVDPVTWNAGAKSAVRSIPRYKSIDYLSIVTRFHMTKRMRESDVETIATTHSADDNRYWLEIDRCIDDSERSVTCPYIFILCDNI